MKKARRKYDAKFKAQVAIEAIKERVQYYPTAQESLKKILSPEL